MHTFWSCHTLNDQGLMQKQNLCIICPVLIFMSILLLLAGTMSFTSSVIYFKRIRVR